MDTNDLLKALGDRIRISRERQRLSQSELAKRIGKTQTAVSEYESGTRAIRITELPMLAEVLGVSMSYLVGEEEPKSTTGITLDLKPFFDQLALDIRDLVQEVADDRHKPLKIIQVLTPHVYIYAFRHRFKKPKRKKPDIAYELFVDARAVVTGINQREIRRKIPQTVFQDLMSNTYKRYRDKEFSLETFAFLLSIEVAPLKDILRHLAYPLPEQD